MSEDLEFPNAKTVRKWKANPPRDRAKAAVKRAIKAGRLTAPDSCSTCGVSGVKIHAHHSSYLPEHRLDVEWLCAPCHGLRHANGKTAVYPQGIKAPKNGRPTLLKRGPLTAAEHQKRYRAKVKRENPNPKTLAKRARRTAREIELAGQVKPVEGLFPVICADPPWRYTTRSQNGMDRSADNHYPTMTVEDIAALPIPATPFGFMAMWATVPLLPEALTVMAAWRYTYRSQCMWVKDRIGTGFWFRNQHEILLIGTRGDIPAPSQPWPSVITAPRGAHSEKPAVFYEMIEAYFPNLPRLEMFARGPRAGWSVWGNES